MTRWCCLLMLLIAAAAGCAGTAENPRANPSVMAEVLYQGNACSRHMAGAVWIDNLKDYESFLGKIGKETLGARSENAARVDFQKSGVLLIHMGQKPTTGYEMTLGEAPVSVSRGVALVSVNWVQPPADALLPQMITRPCILIRLPRAGYTDIRITDQSGRERFRVDARRRSPDL